MRLLFCMLLVATFLKPHAQQPFIVPQPLSLTVHKGNFIINRQTVILAPGEEDRNSVRFFNQYLQQYYGFMLEVNKKGKGNAIRINTRKFIQAPGKDAYSLQVTPAAINIEGDTDAGTFYGLQSLIQLLPLQKGNFLKVPCLAVKDSPRFDYRGLHLDVGRHFFPTSFIKKYIDYLTLHKLNYFHWHLTEDQGWRIQIKKYPRLTEVGAYRNGTITGRYPGTGNDNQRYGGFYTQEEIKEIVQYATARHITVIPEIEMPGHSGAAIAAYPWLSCFPEEGTVIPAHPSEKSKQQGGKLVQETWGVHEDVYCAGKDSTFAFLEDVLEEVLPLFPSPYIHIGGDETPKSSWRRCPSCQKRMKDEGLKDEHELQSYFVQRMEKYLNSKGKTLIGWDEILEGGLAPNAIVMSWRGEAGGIAAAMQQHKVIMSPGNFVYLDHTQSMDEDSVTIGGYTPLEEIYSYEPVPIELSAAEKGYVMGAQGNVWTEYMRNERKVEYMIFPRLSALSEVLWSPKEKRSWARFEKVVPLLFERYQFWNTNYSTAYYDIQGTIIPAINGTGLALQLGTKDKNARLMYSVAGVHYPKNYTAPVPINQSQSITGLYYKNNTLTDSLTYDVRFHKATGKKITLKEPPSKNYPGNGAFTLVDGIQNSRGLARGREFLGFNGNNMESIIDLGAPTTVSNITVHTLHQEGSWVYAPLLAEVMGSTDNKTFTSLGSTTTFKPTKATNGVMQVTFAPRPVRYLKVMVKNTGTITEGKPGAGEKSWMMVDEIEVQ